MGVDMISPLGKEKDIPKEDIPCVGFKFMASVLGRPGWKWGGGGAWRPKSLFPKSETHFRDTERQPVAIVCT